MRLMALGTLLISGLALSGCGSLYRPSQTFYKMGGSIEAHMQDYRFCHNSAFEASRRASANDGTVAGVATGLQRGREAQSSTFNSCALSRGYVVRDLTPEQRAFLSDLPSEEAKNRFLAVIGTGGTIEDYKRSFGSAS